MLSPGDWFWGFSNFGRTLRWVVCLWVGDSQLVAALHCSPLAALPCSAAPDPSASNAATSSPALGGAHTDIGGKYRNPKTRNTEFHRICWQIAAALFALPAIVVPAINYNAAIDQLSGAESQCLVGPMELYREESRNPEMVNSCEFLGKFWITSE